MAKNDGFIYKYRYLIGSGLALAVIGVVLYINRTKVKQIAKEELGGFKWFDESLKWYRDSKTKDIVDKLHPQFRDKVKEFFSKVEKQLGLQMFATSGLRTFDQQAKLHKENPKNAKAGYSDHNYGFAVDVNVIDPKTGKIILRKASSSADWEKSGVVKIAKDMGFSWGGGGAFGGYHDPVHFYIQPKGMKSSQLLTLYNSGKVDSNGYVIV
jgi:hypothetical protein